MVDAKIINNTATNGGGVYVNGTITISNGRISNNTALKGAGLYYCSSSSTSSITRGEISNNNLSI
jgi:predicted outer membrane repeat protein